MYILDAERETVYECESVYVCFFVNDTATTEIYTYGHTLSLHDALPIWIGPDDELIDPRTLPLGVAESWAGGRHRFDGALSLDRSGPFGYTVRVVPRHELAASAAETGLVRIA